MDMRHVIRLLILGLALTAAALPASAACLVEYKAKRDNPLRLDFGIRALPDRACASGAAWSILSAELAAEGWTLLSIVSVRRTD